MSIHDPHSAAPAIILVRPQLGENIGAVARAMANFGLSELRLVSPKNGWPNERAYAMAVSAAPILDAVQLHDSVASAMHDVRAAYATTARGRELEKPVLDARGAAQAMVRDTDSGKKCALLFGPERTGLTNEDLVLADAAVTIPTAAEYASLNLSQAVVIVGYEWFAASSPRKRGSQASTQAALDPGLRRDDSYPPATKQELDSFFSQLEEHLDTLNHFRTKEKKTLMWQNLRSIFTRAAMNDQELRSMRGVIRALYERRR